MKASRITFLFFLLCALLLATLARAQEEEGEQEDTDLIEGDAVEDDDNSMDVEAEEDEAVVAMNKVCSGEVIRVLDITTHIMLY